MNIFQRVATTIITLPVLILLLALRPAIAQNSVATRSQFEISVGQALPQFYSGTELLRASVLRQQGLSYGQTSVGDRRAVGAYPTQRGITMLLGFLRPIRQTGLLLGVRLRNTQTGSEPKNGGYDEAYYFNFITAGPALKYYPLSRSALFVQADAGLASVLTKNRFEEQAGGQAFFHQFGIGVGLNTGLGYSINLSQTGHTALDIQLNYSYLQTRVEVNGIGDDRWRFGALSALVGVNF